MRHPILDPIRPSIQPMHFEMSYRELLKAGSTLQTRHYMFCNAFPPVDWCCWCLWCCNSNDTIRVLLGLQCEKTSIGVLGVIALFPNLILKPHWGRPYKSSNCQFSRTL